MPVVKRIVLPNHPHHVIHRGHNRRDIFFGDGDRAYYLRNLREFKERFGCKVYSYCLMSNHVHMIVNPCENAGSLALLMKRLAARQTRMVNKMKGASGTLWDSRYRSSLIDTERYLPACCRYIEMNPVRAGIVKRPEEYHWSSYRTKTGLAKVEWLDEDHFYSSLGRSRRKRAAEYRSWIEKTSLPGEIDLIRTAAQRGQLTGDRSFIDLINKKIGMRIRNRGQGRPAKRKINQIPFMKNKSDTFSCQDSLHEA